jgi:hypothetical protein
MKDRLWINLNKGYVAKKYVIGPYLDTDFHVFFDYHPSAALSITKQIDYVIANTPPSKLSKKAI